MAETSLVIIYTYNINLIKPNAPEFSFNSHIEYENFILFYIFKILLNYLLMLKDHRTTRENNQKKNKKHKDLERR